MLDQDNPVNRDGTFNIINTAFEPKENKDGGGQRTDYTLVPLAYPKGMEAYALRNPDGSDKLDAVPIDSPERKNPGKADGIMVHVGGQYTAADGSVHTTGSFGCFSLCGKDQGNAGIHNFVGDIKSRVQTNKKAGMGTTIYFQIEKRPTVQWRWKVNGSGRSTN